MSIIVVQSRTGAILEENRLCTQKEDEKIAALQKALIEKREANEKKVVELGRLQELSKAFANRIKPLGDELEAELEKTKRLDEELQRLNAGPPPPRARLEYLTNLQFAQGFPRGKLFGP